MFKKTVKYTDYNGVEREEDFYFDLNSAEITEMELSQEGGMSNLIKKITDAKDMPSLIKLFKELILKSYGEKTPDGRFFVKDEETAKRFQFSPAYSIIFMELATDENKATEFINSIIPQEAISKVKTELENKNK